MEWHLLTWAFLKSPNDLRRELQLAILREGIDAPNQKELIGQKTHGFNFWVSVVESSKNILAIFPNIEKETDGLKHSFRYYLRAVSISSLPPKVRAKMEDFYSAFRKRDDRSYSDFRDFKSHFTLVIERQQDYRRTGVVNCQLCIEGREVVLQALGRDLRVEATLRLHAVLLQ